MPQLIAPSFFVLLFWLCVGHALADYPLQGDFVSRAKNRYNPVDGIDANIILTMHALIHGGMVALITGSVLMGVIETLCHWSIDDQKCAGGISFRRDQALHLACKVLWAFFAAVLYR